jgi:isopenicillin N synthase-like dioxygenase
MTLMNVPVIDISPFLSGSAEGKRLVAEQVGQACRDIGFLVIAGHGIPEELIEATRAVSAEFFALPKAEKLRSNRPADDQVRGYSAVGNEALAASLGAETPPDLKESLSIGPTDVPMDDPYYTNAEAGPHFAPNVWPGQPAALRDIWTRYFAAMETLATEMMRIFALALSLPEPYFDDKVDRHISMFRVLNYPSQLDAPLDGQLRAGAHSDYGSLTILRQENRPGGLQVRNLSGEWVDVPAVPGTFVVNIGDLMAQWTNDLWVSTVHRVVNPPRDLAADSARMSLVFFHQPNYDALVSCLDGCATPDRPAKYEPISSGDHLLGKFVKQTTAPSTKVA